MAGMFHYFIPTMGGGRGGPGGSLVRQGADKSSALLDPDGGGPVCRELHGGDEVRGLPERGECPAAHHRPVQRTRAAWEAEGQKEGKKEGRRTTRKE